MYIGQCTLRHIEKKTFGEKKNTVGTNVTLKPLNRVGKQKDTVTGVPANAFTINK